MGKVYLNENKVLLQELIRIYKPTEIDWLSYQITKNNGLTVHHIDELCEGGKTTLSNLALLTKRAHRAMNMVEKKDIYLYVLINEFFYRLAQEQKPLSIEDYEESRELKRALKKKIYK